ncbi:MAG: MaoC family dehydratase N-terminal domain-containing protein [Actinobacteria bacterium]|nr:MaoC family dehydratase N-terminal domain-containing protein [Actinomycetota bacterium]
MGREARLGKHLDELKVGDRATFQRKVTEQDVLLYMGVSGDLNPLYTSRNYAGRTHYESPIVPVNLVAGFVSGAVSNVLPGNGSTTLAHSYRMHKPARCGEELTAELEIQNLSMDCGEVTIKAVVKNQSQDVILSGELVVQPPLRLKPMVSHAYEDF